MMRKLERWLVHINFEHSASHLHLRPHETPSDIKRVILNNRGRALDHTTKESSLSMEL